jgi:sortase A
MAFLRFFGKLLISVGAGVLLFVLWTLYGTGIFITSREQNKLEAQFQAQAAFPERDGSGENGELEIHGPPKEFDPQRGEPTFRLKIPKIEVDDIVVEGVDEGELQKGPGHYPRCDDDFTGPHCTPFPEVWPGEQGRVIVSAHRTTYGAEFNELDKVGEGDEVITETKWGTFRYVVTEQRIVDAEDTSITVQIHDPKTREIVLTTCHPEFSAEQRLIIFAELEERIE